MRRVENGLEMLDRPTPAAERAASLADVERLNARFGGDALTLRWVARVLAGLPAARPVRVLDVGAGGGALAVRLVEWARRSRRSIRVLALDRDPDSARLARGAAAAYPEIAVVCGDASALPVRRGGVGPAGAAVGALLAESDLRMLVLDRARFPRPKVFGEYLSPQAARVLDRLGVLKRLEGGGAVRLSGMTITAPDGTRLAGRYPC